MKQVELLGVKVDRVSPQEAVAAILSFIQSGKPHIAITANPLMINHAVRDACLMEVFKNAGLVVADGIGVVLAARLWGVKLERLPGIDLIYMLLPLLCEKKYGIYMLGAGKEVIEKAAENICREFPGINITGSHHGYFVSGSPEEKEIINEIKSARPHLLLVGLNTPFQEKWIYSHLAELGVPACMGVGGSFDVISGRLKRAPLWMRKTGLEWLYRGLAETWRIKRLVQLPVFMAKVIWKRIFRG